MPIIVAWFGEMLLSTIGQLAISALVSLGIGIVGTKAVSGVLDSSGIKAMFDSAGAMSAYVGFTGVDQFITIILSAYAGRAITQAARVHFASKRSATSAG